MPLVFSDEERGLEVWVDDDGRSAYALLRGIGSSAPAMAGVWLYNHPGVHGTALTADRDRDSLPPNPSEYVVDEPFMPISSEDELEVDFGGGPGLEAYAQISIRSKVHAYMEARAHTGWCVLAKKSSPVAKGMIVTPCSDGSEDVHLCDYEGDEG